MCLVIPAMVHIRALASSFLRGIQWRLVSIISISCLSPLDFISHFPRKEVVKFLKGTREAICAMHNHRAQSRQNAQAASRLNPRRLSGKQQSDRLPQPEHHSDGEDDEWFPQAHGDEEGGCSCHNPGSIPLFKKPPSKKGRGAGGEQESGLMSGDPTDLEVHRSSPILGGGTESFPFAHRCH